MLIEGYCLDCEQRDTCKKTCKPVQKMIRQKGGPHEKYCANSVTKVYRTRPEVPECMLDHQEYQRASTAVPLQSDFIELKQTGVFVDRFFNQMTIQEVADKYDISRQEANRLYYRATYQVRQIIDVLDRKTRGLKSLQRKEEFSEDQKIFLLVYIFSFNCVEVSELLGRPKSTVHIKAQKMAKLYGQQFIT